MESSYYKLEGVEQQQHPPKKKNLDTAFNYGSDFSYPAQSTRKRIFK